MSNWLGVVSADHVRRGVGLGVIQIGHGKRAPLLRMAPGDWVVYYSPREHMDDKATLRQFTAIGTVTDDEVWQADEGTFQPWRRRVDYLDAHPVGIADLELELTGSANWGYQLRRGLVELSDADLAVIRTRMTS